MADKIIAVELSIPADKDIEELKAELAAAIKARFPKARVDIEMTPADLLRLVHELSHPGTDESH